MAAEPRSDIASKSPTSCGTSTTAAPPTSRSGSALDHRAALRAPGKRVGLEVRRGNATRTAELALRTLI